MTPASKISQRKFLGKNMRNLPHVLLLLAVPGTVSGQTVGANARIDSIFSAFEQPGSPGCAVGVYRNGAIEFARGYGLADLEHRVAITPQTIFDLGSTSKQVTAAAVVLLALDGRLSLDDDVRRWIPELPQYSRPITIRQMLNHTSGLRDYIMLLSVKGESMDGVTTVDDALQAIVRQRDLNFDPGSEFLYSNSGYFLLSVVVERASGRSLRDFARERIFDPLGMQRTHFLGSYDDVVPDRASAYAPRAGTGGTSGRPPEWRLDVSRWLQTGDGAVFSSIEELLLWDGNFHEPKVGGQALLEALHTRGVLANGDTLPYALGLQLTRYRGLRSVSHGGSWGGYRAELRRFPDQRTSVAVLCNAGAAGNAPALATLVADAVLEGVFTAPRPAAPTPPSPGAASRATAPVTLSAAQLAAYAGRYFSAELDTYFTLDVHDGSLRLQRPGAGPARLVAESDGVFSLGGMRLRFQRDGDAAHSFLLDLGRVRNLRFDRVN